MASLPEHAAYDSDAILELIGSRGALAVIPPEQIRTWKPKHNKWREVPLSQKAKAILERRLADGPLPPDEPVFPNRGGCPYERMDGAGEGAGSGWFPAAVEAAGLKG